MLTHSMTGQRQKNISGSAIIDGHALHVQSRCDNLPFLPGLASLNSINPHTDKPALKGLGGGGACAYLYNYEMCVHV